MPKTKEAPKEVSKEAPKEAPKEEPKEQQKPDLHGHGIFTINQLSSWTAVSKKLLAQGWEQREIDFVYHTCICVKGHDHHYNNSKACREFFKTMSPGTANSRIAKRTKEYLTLAFSGQLIEKYLAKYEESHKKQEKETNGKYTRRTQEEKADNLAEKILKASFREENDINSRGKLTSEHQEKLQKYLDEHMENSTKQILAEIKIDSPED